MVTLDRVTMRIEVDAPNAAAARGAIYNALKEDRPFDALARTRLTLDLTERQCENAVVMTTSVPSIRAVKAELA
jgi:hypothetical protein